MKIGLNPLFDLLDRLEGPDREVDKAIGFTLDGWTSVGTDQMLTRDHVFYDHPGAMYTAFTEDIGEVIDLVERSLPGYYWEVARGLNHKQMSYWGYCYSNTGDGIGRDPVDYEPMAYAGPNPAIALLKALVHAHIEIPVVS